MTTNPSPGFQSQVNTKSAPAVEGDFASKNPYWTYDAGPNGLVAGPDGLVVGRAAWVTAPADSNGSPAWADNFGTGDIAGIMHREQQGLLTDYLQQAGMTVPGGFPVTLIIAGDLWVKNNGSSQALPNQKAYANYADGTFQFAATGGSPSTASFTGSIAARTASVTGTISDDILDVTTVGSGTLVAGMTLAGTGGPDGEDVATSTKIVRQLSSAESDGALGKTGTYAVSIPEQAVEIGTITGTVGLLTVAAVASGALEVGDVLSGGTVTSGTVITQLGTGAGQTGTYWVDPTQTTSNAPGLTATRAKETKWYARSAGLAGELVKISSQPLG